MMASGFGEGADWDWEYDGTFHGWDPFHKIMKHYLEHHGGEAAQNAVFYAMLPVPPSEAWARLMSADGLVARRNLDNLTVGAPFAIETSQGDPLAGVIRNHVPGKTFSAMVESLDKSILNLEMSCMTRHGHFLYLCLNTWGMKMDDVDALGGRLKEIVHGLFPQKTAEPSSACGAEASG
jgi:hypothetical protein